MYNSIELSFGNGYDYIIYHYDYKVVHNIYDMYKNKKNIFMINNSKIHLSKKKKSLIINDDLEIPVPLDDIVINVDLDNMTYNISHDYNSDVALRTQIKVNIVYEGDENIRINGLYCTNGTIYEILLFSDSGKLQNRTISSEDEYIYIPFDSIDYKSLSEDEVNNILLTKVKDKYKQEILTDKEYNVYKKKYDVLTCFGFYI